MNLLFSCIGKRGYIADYFRDCLSSKGRITGTSNTPWTPGFCHCDKAYVLPDIASEAYIPAVKEVCEREKVKAVFSFFDPDVAKLSRHAEEFKALGIVPVLPPARIAEICFDKYRTFRFLTEHGFKTAATYSSLEGALEGIRTGRLGYPLYVKPRSGYGSRNTFAARNERELEVFFGLEDQMIIQECLTGQAFDLEICCGLEGDVLSVVLWKKLLSRLGETERAVTCKDRKLIDFGVNLGGVLGNVGPLDADLFVCNGEVYVLELNPRFGGGYPVSHLAGANFPQLLLSVIRGESVTPRIGDYREGVVMMKDLRPIGGEQDRFFSDLRVDRSLVREPAALG